MMFKKPSLFNRTNIIHMKTVSRISSILLVCRKLNNAAHLVICDAYDFGSSVSALTWTKTKVLLPRALEGHGWLNELGRWMT
jgi:hypothetical protein